jgi:hypothetical protein
MQQTVLSATVLGTYLAGTAELYEALGGHARQLDRPDFAQLFT